MKYTSSLHNPPTFYAWIKKLALPLGFLFIFAQAPLNADVFSDYWHDGRAELSSYDYSINRYGQTRKGTAVMIFVAEDFNQKTQTKTNSNRTHSAMKLNLIRDFPTGIYDYNMMTSTFVALSPDFGAFLKSSFSSQEWCGQSFGEINQTKKGWEISTKSYFEQENNRNQTYKLSEGSITEDQLFLIVRGIGKEASGKILMSQVESKLSHRDMTWRKITSNERKETKHKGVLATQQTIKIQGGVTYKFVTEKLPPHRILSWQADYKGMSEKGELIKSKKLKYWEMSGPKDVPRLKELGLNPRPPRTP